MGWGGNVLAKNRKEGSRTRQLAARPSFACVPDCEEDARRRSARVRKKKTKLLLYYETRDITPALQCVRRGR